MNIRNASFILLTLLSLHLRATTIEAQGGPFEIPDNDPAGIDVTFDFTGVSQEVTNLTLTLNIQHTWVGDLSAKLVSPGGESQMVIFSRVGGAIGSAFADSSDLSGNYTFTDQGTDLWQAAANTSGGNVIPPGLYRTSTAGQPNLSNYGGYQTSIAGVFGDLITSSSGVSSDGGWKLNISDNLNGFVGTLNAASLTINVPELIFKTGFEDSVPVITTALPRNRMDFNGNGLADFGVINAENPLTWRISNNDGGIAGTETIFELGEASSNDITTSGDFDGDGLVDAAYWDDSTAQYIVRRSSRPNSQPLIFSIGNSGDDIRALIGDYDGDGIDDPVTFTNGNSSGDPLTLNYIRSSDAINVAVSMGVDNGVQALAIGGEDFNGDGRADLLLETSGNFEVRDGRTGAVGDTFSFGDGNYARVMLGNFSGDNLSDITRVFLDGSDVVWETRESGTGTILPTVTLGSIGIAGFSEFAAEADYDGDGYKDYGVWRRDNATDNSAQFIFRPSRNVDTTTAVTFGSMTESPIVTGQSTN